MRPQVTTTAAGAALVFCAVLVSVALLRTPEPYWSPVLWLHLAGLVGAAVAVALRPGLRRPAAVVAAVLAAQVAGRGQLGLFSRAELAGMPTPSQAEPSQVGLGWPCLTA
jgi:hypothetical protein